MWIFRSLDDVFLFTTRAQACTKLAHNSEEVHHQPLLTQRRSQPWGSLSQQRTSQVLQRGIAQSSNDWFSICLIQKGPRTGKSRALRFGFVYQAKNKSQNWKEGSGEISEFCLVSIQNLKATQVIPKLTQVHQELTWFLVSLPKFCIALQESKLNPERIPCEVLGIILLYSAFFYAYTQITAKSRHL